MEQALDHLMPMPVVVKPREGTLVLTGLSADAPTPRLHAALLRLLGRLENSGSPKLPIVEEELGTHFLIEVQAVVSSYPMPDIDESYCLSISADGVRLTAESDVGALRGLQTLLHCSIVSRGPGSFLVVR
jgi:hexosaminidase